MDRQPERLAFTPLGAAAALARPAGRIASFAPQPPDGPVDDAPPDRGEEQDLPRVEPGPFVLLPPGKLE
jgi:hypothetical protein